MNIKECRMRIKLNTISNKLYGYDYNSANLTSFQKYRILRELEKTTKKEKI